MTLPQEIGRIIVPPIKCQGIKTKLVPFIADNIQWSGEGIWYEPFLGSGVVLFNIQPDRAIVGDTNVHIIKLYKELQSKSFDLINFKSYLEFEGVNLKQLGEDHYYFIRDRFNEAPNSFDFLFLNRSCFNGLMRFNKAGAYNVPSGRKPNRFRKAYITKIMNQLIRVKDIIANHDWEFKSIDWLDLVQSADKPDFVYIDPPYVGRHTDYFNQWDERQAIMLAGWAHKTKADFALSMWVRNKYRFNDHLNHYWQGNIVRTYKHFYHIGSTESLRNSMVEGLILKPNAAKVRQRPVRTLQRSQQEDLAISDIILPYDTQMVSSHVVV